MRLSQNRTCTACSTAIQGRSDKKFCSEYCRNSYNNQQKTNEQFVRSINSLLRRNRQIIKLFLETIGPDAVVFRDDMLRRGFHFEYYTHARKDKEGQAIRFCYEYGYAPTAHGYYRLVRC